MYNPYQMANSFNPYPQAQFSMPQNAYQNQNVLPQQQVLQANGKASIDALRMSPNSSVLIMDSTAPMVWLCTSDSLGNVSASAYDITPHKDAPTADSLEVRLANAEAAINQIWEAVNNGKQSNVGSAKPKQNVRPSPTDNPD